MSFGIALAGGGTRGAAHVGVLCALEEAGLRPDSIAGASAGGIVAGLYASGMSLCRMKEVVQELQKNGRRLMDLNLCGLLTCIPEIIFCQETTLTGLLKGNRLEKLLWSLTEGKTLSESKLRIVIPAVDLLSGQTIAYTNTKEGVQGACGVRWETEAKLSEVMRASSAVPGVFVPKWLGEQYLVDGGVTNVLPVDLLIASGVKQVLAVDIGERYHMPESKNVFEVASHSFTIMSSCLKELTSQGEELLLRPSLPKEAGLLTFEYMEACMEAGYQYTKERIPSIEKIFKA